MQLTGQGNFYADGILMDVLKDNHFVDDDVSVDGDGIHHVGYHAMIERGNARAVDEDLVEAGLSSNDEHERSVRHKRVTPSADPLLWTPLTKEDIIMSFILSIMRYDDGSKKERPTLANQEFMTMIRLPPSNLGLKWKAIFGCG